MTFHPTITDAGPGLTFFSARQERLLFQIVGAVSIPEIVKDEILRKAHNDARFQPASSVMGRLPEKLLRVLPDAQTPKLASVIHRISGMSVEARRLTKRDLGETMVIAHAVVRAEAGEDVIILIDENAGTRTATQEAERLERLRLTGKGFGSLRLLSTIGVLTIAIKRRMFTDRGQLRRIYEHFRTLDDGLVHIDDTQLLARGLWN